MCCLQLHLALFLIIQTSPHESVRRAIILILGCAILSLSSKLAENAMTDSPPHAPAELADASFETLIVIIPEKVWLAAV